MNPSRRLTWLHLSDWQRRVESFDRRAVVEDPLRNVREREKIDLLRAEIADLDGYRTVFRFYGQYRQLAVPPTWARAAAIGKCVLPLPRSTGGENEIWIRLGAEILRA